MLRRSHVERFRGGRVRPYLLKDPALSSATKERSSKTLRRLGFGPAAGNITALRKKKNNDLLMQEQWEHAFPLLNNTNYGWDDQSNNTKYVELANYMPKRSKGMPPWFRGRETYSPLYAEQGRYEYQRYQMVARMPKDYKERFMQTLGDIREATKNVEPLKAMYALYNLIVENYNPQHVHFQSALEGLTAMGEISKARDVWKIMERQMTWPDDKCIAAYLDLCVAAGKKEWAFEAWNRYCTEKRFLGKDEPDPKPISRIPFTLNRDELIHLPKWKKFFDHDPNLDVADRNRFNTTRQIYLGMARVLLRTGEFDMFAKYFTDLENAMMDTATPVPEPPDTVTTERPSWQPSWDQDRVTSANPFAADLETAKNSLGPAETSLNVMAPRFLTNHQFLLHAASALIDDLVAKLPPKMDKSTAANFIDELVERVFTRLGKHLGDLNIAPITVSMLRAASAFRDINGVQAKEIALVLSARKAKALKELEGEDAGAATLEVLHEAVYLEILRTYNAHAAKDLATQRLDPHGTIATATELLREMASITSLEWSADHHLAVVTLLVQCGTMAANTYFVKNVLRRFKWDSRFLFQLYQEYRRYDDVEMWAELTKRMLVWTARYNVTVDEATKRAIEDDYAHIKVQVRSFKELVAFAFKNTEEKRMANDPATLMPNPYMDFVSHALPFPDRDTGAINEYGTIGQMRDPLSKVRGPQRFTAAMPTENQREYTTEFKNPGDPMKPVKLAPGWDRKYAEHARGKHPSYDQVYAGPMPEIFPVRRNFRRETRWDFKDVQNQSKYKFSNPY
jgi:hypothetical protein